MLDLQSVTLRGGKDTHLPAKIALISRRSCLKTRARKHCLGALGPPTSWRHP